MNATTSEMKPAPEIEDAWKDTDERRFENLKKGRTTAREAKQAVREARKHLAKLL